MGGLTSKHVDEIVSDSKSSNNDTPKMRKMAFDPRSPSDDITRTPITMLDNLNNSVETTPTDAKIVVVDPRSPNNEVTRTPIMVEKKEVPRRPLSFKPNSLAKLDSLSGSNDEKEGEEQDPRSPTIKVPRTPLEDKIQELDLGDSYCDQKLDSDETNIKNVPSTQESKETQEQISTLAKKLFTSDELVDKVRRPLVAVQNTNVVKTPRDLIQAKHCKNVEDEYNKNHQNLLDQLSDEEKTVNSNTEFVENI